jgi:hypothetical protein
MDLYCDAPLDHADVDFSRLLFAVWPPTLKCSNVYIPHSIVQHHIHHLDDAPRAACPFHHPPASTFALCVVSVRTHAWLARVWQFGKAWSQVRPSGAHPHTRTHHALVLKVYEQRSWPKPSETFTKPFTETDAEAAPCHELDHTHPQLSRCTRSRQVRSVKSRWSELWARLGSSEASQRCSSSTCCATCLSPRINIPTTSLPRGRHHLHAQRTADVSGLHRLTFTEHSS